MVKTIESQRICKQIQIKHFHACHLIFYTMKCTTHTLHTMPYACTNDLNS